jgi:hypothetical protein
MWDKHDGHSPVKSCSGLIEVAMAKCTRAKQDTVANFWQARVGCLAGSTASS